jgi:predicted Zn-dependent protease
MRLAAMLVLALLAPEAPALAHADILEQITAVNAEIAEAPRHARLYLRRGELHRLHRDPAAAAADYDRAAALAPDLSDIDFAHGRLDLEFGDPGAALTRLDRYVAARPEQVDGYIVRARAREALGDTAGAVADFDRAIGLSPAPGPELFLRRAALQDPAAALAGLDAGIARIGPVATLVQAAVEAALRAERPDAALDRLALMPEAVRGAPIWLALRGDLLARTGAAAEAAEAYDAALDAIAGRSVARRNRDAMRRLEGELREKLAALGAVQ